VPREAPPGPIGELVPVRVELRKLATWLRGAEGEDRSIFNYIDREHVALSRSLRGADLRHLAEASRVLWIFDGLDEVVDAEERAQCANIVFDES